MQSKNQIENYLEKISKFQNYENSQNNEIFLNFE